MHESIRELLEKEPFLPFRVLLTSGQGYDIANPHLAVLMESQMIVCFPKSDRFAILRLNQVASLEILETAA